LISILIFICCTLNLPYQADSLPDTIPVPQDTIPVPADTIPEFPDTLQVVPDTVLTDTIPAPADSLEQQRRIRQEQEEEEELKIVPTWPDLNAPGFKTAETDSTLRWFMALDWTERLYRQAGVLTYRTGRLGHPSGIDIHSYENRHQELMMNDISVTDPVTGQVNWNRIPIHKIRTIETDNDSYKYRARVNLREHYVVQPRTYLNFDEGKHNYRYLEFSFTHNFSPQTNLELSFWDRKDGDLYPRNNMEGRQIVFKARHNLSEEVLLKAGYIDNSLEQQQPFGYNIPDLLRYDFNPYNAIATESSANSKHSTNDIYVQIFQRRNEDQAASRAAGISYQNDNWELFYSQDTTAYNLRDIHAFAWQDVQAGRSSLRARADIHALRDGSGVSLNKHTWIKWNGSFKGEFPLFPWLEAGLTGNYEGRSDGFTGYEASFSLTLRPFQWFELGGFGGLGSSIPDIQALYWNSGQYQGNRSLQNESAMFAGFRSRINLGNRLSFGVRADAREVSNGVFINSEGNFLNIEPYMNLSGSAWLKLDSEHFEGMMSATGQTFSSNSGNQVNVLLDRGGERLWFKGSLHWKNYLFNKATYIKAGITGMFSPGNYIPSGFMVPLNRWQHGYTERYLPDFHRLDVDFSARVRWIMLLIRWENVLDRITQLGYFESENYPMPGNRLVVGLRVVFTN
jgi:hypothetical protein